MCVYIDLADSFAFVWLVRVVSVSFTSVFHTYYCGGGGGGGGNVDGSGYIGLPDESVGTGGGGKSIFVVVVVGAKWMNEPKTRMSPHDSCRDVKEVDRRRVDVIF